MPLRQSLGVAGMCEKPRNKQRKSGAAHGVVLVLYCRALLSFPFTLLLSVSRVGQG